MKVVVCLKEVLDARLPLQVEARTGLVGQTGSARLNTLNPADRSALEAAMELRSQIPGARVEAFSVCDLSGQEALWFARARGVDSVERVVAQESGLAVQRAKGCRFGWVEKKWIDVISG